MNRAVHLLALGLAAAPGLADQPAPPTPDLLLYLAEWQVDAQGRLVDPLDVPAEVDDDADSIRTDHPVQTPPMSENPQ